MKKSVALVAGLFALGLAASAAADQYEDAIDYRQAAFTLIKGNFKPMGAMVKEEIPFDAEAFAEYAASVAALSKMADDGFIEGSDMGDTDAKPEVWENRKEFDAKMKQFQEAALALAEAAESGDMGAIKPRFAATGKSCKSCHDDFKKD